MPLSDPDLIDLILASDTGRIASLNLIGGLRVGQFSQQRLRTVLRLWVHYLEFAGKRPSEAAAALGVLPSLHHAPPVGYVPPVPIAFDLHILDREPGGLKAGSRGSAVKDGDRMANLLVLTDPDDDGVDFSARPGSVSYARLMKNTAKTYKTKIRDGKTITNPHLGSYAVMFYTDAQRLDAELDATASKAQADMARDRLGLVLVTGTTNLVVLTFDGTLVEDRSDRGRPTAVDAGAYPRFACELERAAHPRAWGQTADLGQVTATDIGAGLPERVCGPFPPPGAHSVRIAVRFIGRPSIPRSDFPGIGDDAFADALNDIATRREPGFSLRSTLLAHLS